MSAFDPNRTWAQALASLAPVLADYPNWSAPPDGYVLGNGTDIVRLLEQRLGVPHAAPRSKEIAIVDVDRRVDFIQRIDDRVNNVATKDRDIANAQRFAARRLDGKLPAAGDAAPEHVVFASGVEADHSAHLVLVRHDDLLWWSKPVQNRQFGRVMKHLDRRFVWFAKLAHDGSGIGDRTRHDFCHCLAGALAKNGSKVSDELVPVKHANLWR